MRISHLLFIVVIIVLVSSCAEKRVMYIQSEAGKLDEGEEYDDIKPKYKLLPEDILYIRLTTTNEEIKDLISLSKDNAGNQAQGNQQGRNFYLTGFTIDEKGNIDVPTLGIINVKGMNIKEAERVIQSRTDEIFEGVKAIVKLVSFKVTWLGEVGSKGTKLYFQDNLNIVEALAGVGGITNFGDRENVLILRKKESGYQSIRVDVTKRDIMESENFYLQPNDIVYVEAIKTKAIRVGVGDFFFYMSTIVTIISTALLITKLE